MVSIVGLSKAAVLAALFNASKQQVMGFLNPGGSFPMSEQEAQDVIENSAPDLYFDYLKGRVLKVEISGDTFDPRLYDRDLGDGAAKRAIETLRQKVGL